MEMCSTADNAFSQDCAAAIESNHMTLGNGPTAIVTGVPDRCSVWASAHCNAAFLFESKALHNRVPVYYFTTHIHIRTTHV